MNSLPRRKPKKKKPTGWEVAGTILGILALLLEIIDTIHHW